MSADSIKSLVCVEYPGIVENVDKAIETLSGINNLERTYNQGTERLELRFRPGDVYAHGTFGDRAQVNNLLVKFKKITRKKSDGTVEVTTKAEVVGVIFTCYQFKTMADFQYLPMRRTEDIQDQRPIFEDISEELIPEEAFASGAHVTFNAEAPLFVTPTIFSRFDTPSDFVFKSGPKHRDETICAEVERQQNLSIIGRTRRSRAVAASLMYWKDEAPTAPKPEALDAAKRFASSAALSEKVDKLFEERPIWTKLAIVYNLQCSKSDLKYILPCRAFYYKDGPFRCLWVKFGFNPKIDKSATRLMCIDFRLKDNYRKNALGSKDVVVPKRSVYAYQMPMVKGDDDKNPRSRKPVPGLKLGSELTLAGSSSRSDLQTEEQVQERRDHMLASFVFKAGVVPTMRMMIYQLVDIHADEVQAILDSDPLDREECSEDDGWFADGTIERIRLIMDDIVSDSLADAVIASGSGDRGQDLGAREGGVRLSIYEEDSNSMDYI